MIAEISPAELRGLSKSLGALKVGMQRRVVSKSLQAGGGVYKDALKAGDWPKRTGELKRSFIVRRFGNYGVGVGARWKNITVGRAALKSGRLGKLRKVTKSNEAKTRGAFTINPGRYSHLAERHARVMSTQSRSKRSRAIARIVSIARRETQREAAKAYSLSKGKGR